MTLKHNKSKETKAYIEGSNRFYDRMSINPNPYKIGTDEHREFIDGWYDAKADANNRKVHKSKK